MVWEVGTEAYDTMIPGVRLSCVLHYKTGALFGNC
jgi:hypothetical protein